MTDKNKSVYISLDCEMGGIGTNCSLLTAYFVILDSDLKKIDDLYLYCKPDDGIYRVTGRAMEINGIDLKEHDKIAKTYKECKPELYDFLDRNRGVDQLIPIGQNIRTDMNIIIHNLISEGSWWQFVSYRSLDTATIAAFAIEVGLLPSTVNAGLKSMAEYLEVGTQPNTGHDAAEDVWLSVGVFKELKRRFRANLKY